MNVFTTDPARATPADVWDACEVHDWDYGSAKDHRLWVRGGKQWVWLMRAAKVSYENRQMLDMWLRWYDEDLPAPGRP